MPLRPLSGAGPNIYVRPLNRDLGLSPFATPQQRQAVLKRRNVFDARARELRDSNPGLGQRGGTLAETLAARFTAGETIERVEGLGPRPGQPRNLLDRVSRRQRSTIGSEVAAYNRMIDTLGIPEAQATREQATRGQAEQATSEQATSEQAEQAEQQRQRRSALRSGMRGGRSLFDMLRARGGQEMT